jgi:phenylacetate-coenzyme A ligase PaaK-like adenylate-forming protein
VWKLSFISEAVLRLRYMLSELRTIHPGRRLYRRMMGNARYTFRLVGTRISSETYGFDPHAVKSSRSVEELVARLPATDPHHYVAHMDEYNEWIAEKSPHASDIVLTSGTSGKPKIVTYSRHDSYRDLLVIARGLRLSYPEIDLRRLLFLLELATAYPAASSALTSHISSGLGLISIPT